MDDKVQKMVTPQKKNSESSSKTDKSILKNEEFSDNELNSSGKKEVKFLKKVKAESSDLENSHLQEQNSKDPLYFEDLTEDYDIYTFQCPENLNIKDLKNLVLNKSNLSDKMTVNFIPLEKELTVAFPSKTFGGCLMNAPIQGHMVIQKAVEIPKGIAKDTSVDDNWMTKYPEDIKVRHPLLGVDWEAHIKSAEKNIAKYKSSKRKSKSTKKRKIVEVENNNVKKSKKTR